MGWDGGDGWGGCWGGCLLGKEKVEGGVPQRSPDLSLGGARITDNSDGEEPTGGLASKRADASIRGWGASADHSLHSVDVNLLNNCPSAPEVAR